MASPQHKEWWKGMEREVTTMEKKYVLELVPEEEMPAGKKALQTMWGFQIKTDNDGNVIRFRPRLCARGDKQEPGIDFLVMETFSPVVRMASFRLFVALCVLLELDPFSCDINTAYLNARLKIKHFRNRIAGFPLRKGWVYKVKHVIYGLHQSGREWYEELDSWLTGRRWRRCTTEPCLYVYTEDGVSAILLVYVDDLICATNDEKWKVEFFQALNTKYGIKDQTRLHEYLGIQVDWTNEGAFLHQEKYAKDVLNGFGFGDARGCRSPMDPTTKLSAAPAHCEPKDFGIEYTAAIGPLMYTATSTRLDLAYPVGYLSRFVGNPTVQHGGALKRVFRYLVTTSNHGILFKRPDGNPSRNLETITIDGYCDSDWGNCPDTRRSITGYSLMIAGGPVACATRRQSVVAQSTAQAEYVASREACMEGKSLINILTEAVLHKRVEFTLGVGNQAAIAQASNPTYSRKTRHDSTTYVNR
ncbi:hypothetical protein PI124_g10104 [Phytophthora idaei]|nr:hypothetical protein PI126_g13298 [Phytophthora idaei]KAG3245140.1 hypothetical protein PI124_g10104 [Phytophthora idaei]